MSLLKDRLHVLVNFQSLKSKELLPDKSNNILLVMWILKFLSKKRQQTLSRQRYQRKELICIDIIQQIADALQKFYN